VLMRYGASNGWLDGQPAVITRVVGKGRITYIGAIFDPGLMAAGAGWMVKVSGVRPVFSPLPEGVEVCRRVANQRTVFILLNHTRQPVQVPLPHPMHAEITTSGEVSAITLPAYGVEVLEGH